MVASPTSPAAAPARSSWLRTSLLIGDLAALLLVLAAFPRFPHIEGPLLVEILTAAFLVGSIWLGSAIAFFLLRATSPSSPTILRMSVPLGIALSILWVVYILVTHFVHAMSDSVASAFTWLTLALTALAALIMGGFVAWRTRSILAGLGVGFWIGLLTGVVSALSIMLMLLFGMDFLVHYMNSGELQSFIQSGWKDRESWYFWQEEIAGSIGAFLLLFLGGVVLGAVGGVVGWLFARVRPSSAQNATIAPHVNG